MLNAFSSIRKILKLIIFLTKMVDSFLGYDFYINLVLFFWGGGRRRRRKHIYFNFL